MTLPFFGNNGFLSDLDRDMQSRVMALAQRKRQLRARLAAGESISNEEWALLDEDMQQPPINRPDAEPSLPSGFPRMQPFPEGLFSNASGLFADTVPKNRQHLFPSLFPDAVPRMQPFPEGLFPDAEPSPPSGWVPPRGFPRPNLPPFFPKGAPPAEPAITPMHIPFGDTPPRLITLEVNRGLKKGTQGPGVGQYEVVPMSGTKTKGRATRKRLNRSR